MSEKYELIKGLELEVGQPQYFGAYATVVSAVQLEALLQRGVRVYGNDNTLYGETKDSKDTHSGLLIGYAPIPKLEPVSVEEIIENLEKASTAYKHGIAFSVGIVKLIERLKSAGVVK